MGDRGGKKDREKQKQQHVNKQKQEEQRKQDKRGATVAGMPSTAVREPTASR